ncbi:MAG TPA: tyrosine-type recombinase/integrase [Rhizomicrobium sp.]
MRHSVRASLVESTAFSSPAHEERQSRPMLYDQLGNRKYLTASERHAFMDASRRASPEVETFCLTLAHTGARISEVLALIPARIDTSAQAIVIESLKKRMRGIYRAVPVPTELLARLEQVHSISKAQTESQLANRRIWKWGRTTAWLRVKEVMQDAGIGTAWSMPKALRHGFGVIGVADAGVPLNMMQKWLGHARIETTAIYANAIGREERTIAKRMWISDF